MLDEPNDKVHCYLRYIHRDESNVLSACPAVSWDADRNIRGRTGHGRRYLGSPEFVPLEQRPAYSVLNTVSSLVT